VEVVLVETSVLLHCLAHIASASVYT